MKDSDQIRAQQELDRLRQALDEETARRLDLQRQLDRAAADFEAFVSMAAHNMKEPLRDVTAFAELIAETSAAHLDAEAKTFLDRIRQGAAKMESILADVVHYWASAAGDSESSRTDMDAVLLQALLLTGKWIEERQAIVTHDPLPEGVMANFGVTVNILHHLVRNAIAYGGAPPRVHISSRRIDRDWAFSVADNGPGIDPAFQDRLFQPFRRLHGREYPGNGLGLAFCKKAVEWQGGRIWVESKPGGSTFCFTLPSAD